MVTCDLKVISYQSQTIFADTASKLLGPYRFFIVANASFLISNHFYSTGLLFLSTSRHILTFSKNACLRYRLFYGCSRYLQVFGTIGIQRDCYFKVLRDKF